MVCLSSPWAKAAEARMASENARPARARFM
jgi:hypothetical protein